MGDLGFILHSRHQYHWHTGYAPPLSVAAPHLGSVVARTLGPGRPDVPAFVDIGQDMEIGAESDSLKAFHTAGFLGAEYGPLLIPDPATAAGAMRPPQGVNRSRAARRYRAYRRLVAESPVLQEGTTYQQKSLLRYLDKAHRLVDSPAAAAFDLSRSPRRVTKGTARAASVRAAFWPAGSSRRASASWRSPPGTSLFATSTLTRTATSG